MDVTAGFVPGAKGAGGDVFADAFFRAAEEGKFPIVNGAGAVGREVGDPAALDEGIDDAVRAIFHEMRAIHENDAGIARAGGGDFFGAIENERFDFGRAGRRSFCRIDQDFFDGAKAAALGEGQDFDAL